MYYKLIGKEVVKASSQIEWAKWHAESVSIISRTNICNIGNVAEVSTVFLGLDHALGGSRPILFETMVFGGDLNGEMERYSTYDEAFEGHERMVERVLNKQKGNVE
jgi:hypothetical protein